MQSKRRLDVRITQNYTNNQLNVRQRQFQEMRSYASITGYGNKTMVVCGNLIKQMK